MSDQNENIITLPIEHTDQALYLNGVLFKISAQGDIEILKERNAFVQDVDYMCLAPSNEGQTIEAKIIEDKVNVGDEMPDGTIFVGLDFEGNGLYSVSSAVPGRHTIDATFNMLRNLDSHGHEDWRLPHGDERKRLSESRHAGKLSGLFHERNSRRDRFDALYWVTYGAVDKKKVGTKSFYSDDFVASHSARKQRIAPVRSGPIPAGFI